MAFRRSFAPAIANSANVKGLPNDQSEDLVDGTVKSNKVAEADLRFLDLRVRFPQPFSMPV